MRHLVVLLFLFLFSSPFINAQGLSAESKEKIHQFDFWIGEWTVYNYGTDTIAGYSRIVSIMDSMAIQENYSVPNNRGNYKGTSLNKYNFVQQQWEQYYIDNAGTTLPLKGGLTDGKMILSNAQKGANGIVFNRITWVPEEDGSVRQTWHSRTNENEDWQVLFDGHYRKTDN